ncbi:MAG: DNA-3-methyladenine glycosylase 2 family protein [Coriobacteriales bacterium]|nr:DNA-3-methyladenine glycosylase 2 family protein [Coriobacteriales bacterium]
MAHDFAYGRTELEHLRNADAAFARLIDYYDSHGILPRRPVEDDPFVALVRAINDQLISLKAASSIWGRICAIAGDPPTPATLASLAPEALHSCGTTRKKAEYMCGIARMVVDGELDLDALRSAPDAEIERRLVALRGIGKWTAEMLLIHAFERADVISFGDAGIRRGMCMLYGLAPDELTQARFEELSAPYHPFSTVASIYLWQLSKEGPETVAELAARH